MTKEYIDRLIKWLAQNKDAIKCSHDNGLRVKPFKTPKHTVKIIEY